MKKVWYRTQMRGSSPDEYSLTHLSKDDSNVFLCGDFPSGISDSTQVKADFDVDSQIKEEREYRDKTRQKDYCLKCLKKYKKVLEK